VGVTDYRALQTSELSLVASLGLWSRGLGSCLHGCENIPVALNQSFTDAISDRTNDHIGVSSGLFSINNPTTDLTNVSSLSTPLGTSTSPNA